MQSEKDRRKKGRERIEMRNERQIRETVRGSVGESWSELKGKVRERGGWDVRQNDGPRKT